MSEILLIYPPVAKPSEPPAGIAKLAGALKGCGVSCEVADLNLEGLDFILKQRLDVSDTWSLRAGRHIDKNRVALSTISTYQNFDRYKRAVADINRVVEVVGKSRGIELSLANYQDKKLSPLRSQDLLGAAERPEENLYYPFFSKRLSELCDLCNPSFIGFSLNYLSQALTTFAMIGFCRKEFPGLPVVVGGGLVTSWSARPEWNNPFSGLIDHLIAGPGEVKLLELMGKDLAGSDSKPDYSGFSELEYLAPGRILPYAASSGCYWNKCAFCPEKAEGSYYCQVPPKVALQELTQLLGESRYKLLHFLDNT
ncbi:MAG: radical SAM protein, partial [Deltaproteobacteria bacterium]|nr:radical SAM protein [Deltaproteobacteria bacterium]